MVVPTEEVDALSVLISISVVDGVEWRGRSRTLTSTSTVWLVAPTEIRKYCSVRVRSALPARALGEVEPPPSHAAMDLQ